MSVKAIWNGVVVAETDDTVMVEGNHYFPREALVEGYFEASRTKTVCPWKGVASYYSITVGGQTNPDGAWYYAKPFPLARKIKGRVAFWRGVEVIVDDTSAERKVTR